MTYTAADHTWIICAYRESPYLEECILSLRGQSVKSAIRIATSTPNEHKSALAGKYGLEVFVNTGEAGIGGDWNFALGTAETKLRTIAHQDDVYDERYTEDMLERMNRAKRPVMYFTNYGELRDGERVTDNRLLRVKRILLGPVKYFPGAKWAKRAALAFGNGICCPSITYVEEEMKGFTFGTRLRSNLDWEMSERLSRKKGSFVYCPEIRMYHRIHAESATTGLIGENRRTEEDYEMFRKFWPEGIARMLCRAYAKSEESNQV